MLKEFKEFISRGNVIDLAVGVVIGGAFTAIVNSLVNDILMPLISLLTGGLDFSAWVLPLAEGPDAAAINFGALVSAVINFLLIGLVLFLLVKGMNKLHRKKAAETEAVKEARLCPYCRQEIADDATRCPHCTSEL